MSARRESPRKRSRAAALQVLFSLDFGDPGAIADAPDASDATPDASDAAPDASDAAPDASDAAPGPDLEARAQEAFDGVGAHFELPEGARAFAKELVLGVARHRASLDALVAEHSAHWRLERMASVDRNVLRLGAFELVHSDAPAPVVIDEAVELARRFGGDRSPAFVNGVLDALATAVRTGGEAT